jgi:hypothetical protein
MYVQFSGRVEANTTNLCRNGTSFLKGFQQGDQAGRLRSVSCIPQQINLPRLVVSLYQTSTWYSESKSFHRGTLDTKPILVQENLDKREKKSTDNLPA